MSEFTELVAPTGSAVASVVWTGNSILLSRPADGEILRHDLDSDSTEVFRRHTGVGTAGATGIAAGSDGRIYGCQTHSRRMVQYHDDGRTSVLQDQLGGSYHNFPRYAVVDARQRVWFADAHLPIRSPGPQVFPPLDHASVLRLEETDDGWLIRRMTTDTVNPMAIALAGDDDLLYVVDKVDDRREQLRSYSVTPGGLDDATIVAEFATAEGISNITGIDVAPDGRVVLASENGVLVLSSDGTEETLHDVGTRPSDVAISPRGELAVGTIDGAVLLRKTVP